MEVLYRKTSPCLLSQMCAWGVAKLCGSRSKHVCRRYIETKPLYIYIYIYISIYIYAYNHASCSKLSICDWVWRPNRELQECHAPPFRHLSTLETRKNPSDPNKKEFWGLNATPGRKQEKRNLLNNLTAGRGQKEYLQTDAKYHLGKHGGGFRGEGLLGGLTYICKIGGVC